MGIDPVLTRQALLRAGLSLPFLPALARAQQIQAEPAATGVISEADLAVADRLGGVSFSPAQHKLALGSVRERAASYSAVREMDLANSVEPDLVFQPYGRKPEREPVVAASPVFPMEVPSGRELLSKPVAELAFLLRSGALTSERLTGEAIACLKRLDPVLKCVVTLLEEQAMDEARQADAELKAGGSEKPLLGIPYGVKDLFATKAGKTTWGAEAFRDQEFDFDATVVRRLREAGAVCTAKLTCGALAYDDVWFGGQTKNPWNLKQGSSGSSAGSASAVSAGILPFAIGTETLGSIMSPSFRCRVTGLRPTYGRVSRHGCMQLSWTNDKVGPIVRHASDALLVLRAIAGHDPEDRATLAQPMEEPFATGARGGKIGWFSDEEGAEPVFVGHLRELGYQVDRIKLTPPPDAVLTCLLVEASAAFDKVTRGADIEKIGKLWPPEFLAARYVPAVEYVQALRVRAVVARRFEEELGDFDAVVAEDTGGSLLITTNNTGHPQMIIPWGTNEKGAPKAVSIVGRLYDEAKVCEIAGALQSKAHFHEMLPPL
ncbi:MAG: amidase [Fimbriimonadaceae bacterium]|nr:amidase [Fimbriimonadaceae bacterium]QYK54926.1 MAG: amidase [Fimbriimonadaceae bacterium]